MFAPRIETTNIKFTFNFLFTGYFWFGYGVVQTRRLLNQQISSIYDFF